jgi:hypothetical protein
MGYFDALTDSSFKTAQDGTRLFFPWGIMSRGYCIATEQDYLRLRQQIKAYIVVSFVLIVPLVILVGVAAFAILVPLVGFYFVWMGYVLRRMELSDERLSYRESMTSQARAHSLVFLRLVQIGSIVLAICGGMILLSSGSRFIALASIIFFGFCAASVTRMIALRRSATGQP